MNYKISSFVVLLVYFFPHILSAESVRTQGRFLDIASDYKVTVAYVYEGCRHRDSDCYTVRRPIYYQNKALISEMRNYAPFCSVPVHFMVIDTSRCRIKGIRQLLSITQPDSFIIFIDGAVAHYDYLTGTPSKQELINYIESVAGEVITACQSGKCSPRKERYRSCAHPRQTAYGNVSWQVQGYYGSMGGEPPLGYGYSQAGAYSFGMGFRRPPN